MKLARSTLLDKIYVSDRRMAKRELSNPTKIGYRKVTSAYDIHANEDISTDRFTLCHANTRITNTIW